MALIGSTTIESPVSSTQANLPGKYRDYQDVFIQTAATKLPPHRPWDCAIDLLPGAKLPKGKVYPLSIPENKAMEEYISEALQQGFIRPSTSPAASSFFFVAKKDGGLRPCIDYCVLNSQTVKFAYPVPLVPAALEELCRAHIFSKLDLRSAYNLIHILQRDEWKMAFITLLGHYEYLVMPYGLSNAPSVFQRFMNEIFQDMLHKFVVVYIDDILIYSPNLSDHFLGYVISPEGIQMDCAKVEAIKSWPQPGTVKDLQRFLGFANFYRRFISGEAKRLKPRQARWALFFTRFNFCVTYHPGNKNTKANALSRIHSPDPLPEEPEPILPPDLFVCPITWLLDDDIRAATVEEPATPGGPDGKAYVPTSLCLSLLDSVHASLGSSHPGRQRTLSLLKEWYWWPNMAEDVSRFVRGCSVCAMVSTSRCLPEGKLVPLPIPCRPWSHLGIDFAMDLPVSNGFTTILITVDRFSKACELIPLKGLPTALETMEALFSNIFRYFGIVSDRGPQFISRVWRGFFKLLGVSVSLSSGYHPQTNGQTERKIQEIGRYLRAYCHDH
ncbi:hypothetical protein QTP86_002648 [Hemibagrus guttatus]|nr:hypothetical protein QTP86_002648 [Hemibagrus guttatus]